jgi:hypothetical protein
MAEEDSSFYLIKDGTFFPLFCLTNPAQVRHHKSRPLKEPNGGMRSLTIGHAEDEVIEEQEVSTEVEAGGLAHCRGH